jgi:hypothetical protein
MEAATADAAIMNQRTKMLRIVVWACAAVFALYPRSASTDAPGVDRYDYFEAALIASRAYALPVVEVDLQVNVRQPNGAILRVDGFWDGENTWKFRVMGRSEGVHRFVTRSNDPGLNNRIGAFTVTNRLHNKGPMRVNPNRPHAFVFEGTGEPVFPIGLTARSFLSDAVSPEKRRRFIDFLVAHKMNRLILHSATGPAIEEFRAAEHGPSVWPFGGAPTDLFSGFPQPSYVEYDVKLLSGWDEAFAYMRKFGVIAYIWLLYDDNSITGQRKNYRKMTSSYHGDAPLPNGLTEEETYFKYMVARYAAFSNINWNLALEYTEYRDHVWAHRMGRFLKDLDPYDHLLSIHSHANFPFTEAEWADFQAIQQRGSPSDLNNNVILHRQRMPSKPVVNEEFGYPPAQQSRADARQDAWAIALAGGFLMSGNVIRANPLPWPLEHVCTPSHRVNKYICPRQKTRGSFFADFEGLDREKAHAQDLMHLYTFIAQIDLSEATPCNALISDGGVRNFCLGKSGSDYVVYLSRGGPVTVDLANVNGTLYAEWYNPRTGGYAKRHEIAPRRRANFTPPFDGDAVLRLNASGRRPEAMTPPRSSMEREELD